MIDISRTAGFTGVLTRGVQLLH